MDIIARPKAGDAIDASSTMYPCRIETLTGTRAFTRPTSTTYGVVVSGAARLRVGSAFDLSCDAGTWFCVPGDFSLDAGAQTVLIEKLGFRGMLGAGRIEAKGRLSYIDGCSDSILAMPPRMGDPVLNLLHFPAGVDQTLHAHPSVRLGVVVGGHGIAHGPSPAETAWEHPLSVGAIFLLHAQETHAFKTGAGSHMDVVAFHPDSDWGPTDLAHPMLNRTYLARK